MDKNRGIFIHDQVVRSLDPSGLLDELKSLLAVPGRDPRKSKEPSQVGQGSVESDFDNQLWPVQHPRQKFLADLSIKRLCVTEVGGVGKSILLEEIEYLILKMHPEHLVLRFNLDRLPESYIRLLDEKQKNGLPPLLVYAVETKTDEILASSKNARLRNQLPEAREKRREMLRSWLQGYIRRGEFTLIVDAIDQQALSTAKDQMKETVRDFLRLHPEIRCVIAGRPYAIQSIWDKLALGDVYELGEEDGVAKSARPSALPPSQSHIKKNKPVWEFCLVERFSATQIGKSRKSQAERYLGSEKWNAIQQLGGRKISLPRTLNEIRKLSPEDARQIRNASQLYHHVIFNTLYQSLANVGDPEQRISVQDAMAVVGAVAFGMMFWKSPDGLTFEPVTLISSADERNPESMQNFFHELKGLGIDSRLSREGSGIDLAANLIKVSHLGLSDLRLQVYRDQIDVRTSQAAFREQLAHLEMDDTTVRDFYAAYFASRYFDQVFEYKRESESGDQIEQFPDRLLQRMRCNVAKFFSDPVEASFSLDYHKFWQFLGEMPRLTLRRTTDSKMRMVVSSNRSYARSIKPLFEVNARTRPTGLMFCCWKNLLLRSEWKIPWDGSDLDKATSWAQTRVQKDFESGKRKSDFLNEPVNEILFGFLSEYLLLKLDGSRKTRRIIGRDLEGQFVSIDRPPNGKFRCGHSREEENQEKDQEIEFAFSICRFAVTNRIYSLFDPHHIEFFCDYYWSQSDKPRCGATNLTWYDATMCSIFLHARLPNEWEWEYACRKDGVRNADGSNAKWYFGNNSRDLVRHAVYLHPPWSFRVFPVGKRKPNPSGLYDMLGNVFEWTSSEMKRYFRVARGGSAVHGATDSSCSHRLKLDPSNSGGGGFRVVRSEKRKP